MWYVLYMCDIAKHCYRRDIRYRWVLIMFGVFNVNKIYEVLDIYKICYK